MAKKYAVDAAPAAEAQGAVTIPGKSVTITWNDTGRHVVEIRGIRRRAELEQLLRAAQRHAFVCQSRGLPISTEETQYGRGNE